MTTKAPKEVRLTRYRMFALQVLLECLQHPEIPRPYRTDGFLRDSRIKDLRIGAARLLKLNATIHGSPTSVVAYFKAGAEDSPGDDFWGAGICSVSFPERPGSIWVFRAEIIGNEINVVHMDTIELGEPDPDDEEDDFFDAINPYEDTAQGDL